MSSSIPGQVSTVTGGGGTAINGGSQTAGGDGYLLSSQSGNAAASGSSTGLGLSNAQSSAVNVGDYKSNRSNGNTAQVTLTNCGQAIIGSGVASGYEGTQPTACREPSAPLLTPDSACPPTPTPTATPNPNSGTTTQVAPPAPSPVSSDQPSGSSGSTGGDGSGGTGAGGDGNGGGTWIQPVPRVDKSQDVHGTKVTVNLESWPNADLLGMPDQHFSSRLPVQVGDGTGTRGNAPTRPALTGFDALGVPASSFVAPPPPAHQISVPDVGRRGTHVEVQPFPNWPGADLPPMPDGGGYSPAGGGSPQGAVVDVAASSGLGPTVSPKVGVPLSSILFAVVVLTAGMALFAASRDRRIWARALVAHTLSILVLVMALVLKR